MKAKKELVRHGHKRAEKLAAVYEDQIEREQAARYAHRSDA